MKLRTYIWRWLGAAFSHALGVIDLWAGLGGAVVAGIAHFLPQEQAAELNSLAWQVPLWALGVVMLVRIVLAPYWLYRDLDSDYSTLKGRITTHDQLEGALTRLADIWEAGTTLRNVLSEKNPPSLDDVAEVAALEEQIYENVGIVSRSQVGLFRTINQFDVTQHAVAFQRHTFLLHFSERLRRLKPFIENHQPERVIAPR